MQIIHLGFVNKNLHLAQPLKKAIEIVIIARKIFIKSYFMPSNYMICDIFC